MLDSGVDDLTSLMHRAIAGDAEALDQLVECLYPRLLRFVRQWYRPIWEAWCEPYDLVQEILLRIPRSLPECRAANANQFLGWCFAIARHTVIDHLRTSYPERTLREFLDLDGFPDTCSDEIPSTDDSSVFAALNRAYNNEPEHIQALLWYRLVERRSWAEVGSLLTTTEAGAKRMFQRAQQRLRKVAFSRTSDCGHADEHFRAETALRAMPADPPTEILDALGLEPKPAASDGSSG